VRDGREQCQFGYDGGGVYDADPNTDTDTGSFRDANSNAYPRSFGNADANSHTGSVTDTHQDSYSHTGYSHAYLHRMRLYGQCGAG